MYPEVCRRQRSLSGAVTMISGMARAGRYRGAVTVHRKPVGPRAARATARGGRPAYRRTRPMIVSPRPAGQRPDRSTSADRFTKPNDWTKAGRQTVNVRPTG